MIIKGDKEKIRISPEKSEYAGYREEYEEVLPLIYDAMDPKAAFVFTVFPEAIENCPVEAGTEVCFLIMTLGRELSRLIEGYFKNDDYFCGMMCDSFASSALLSFEEQVLSDLRDYCREKHKGIACRYEAPSDIPLSVHSAAFSALNAGENLGIGITDGLMFDPVKTCCLVFKITDEDVFNISHDCNNCEKKDCPERKDTFRVELVLGDERKCFSARTGDILMDIFRNNGEGITSPCGGKGICGKCGVRIYTGDVDITDRDREFFSEEELKRGYRLSCRAVIRGDIVAEPLRELQEISVPHLDADGISENDFSVNGCGIAIDLGTTTLCFALTDLRDGKIIDTVSTENPQRLFGADVISRIEAAGKGKAKELKSLICDALFNGTETLIKRNPGSEKAVRRMCIAGNTTMLHLLRGYDVSSLGSFPFIPVNISPEKPDPEELMGDRLLSLFSEKITVFLLPGVSAFIGADIVSGMYHLNFLEMEKPCALIDLGTNGEMVIGNRERILAASTAAGPAFEGGRIKWGMPSVPGAISNVYTEGESIRIGTIGDVYPPRGICGTGIIETVSVLLRLKNIDCTGLLKDQYFDDGFPIAENEKGETIFFTEDDIREVQLAKSAVIAGFQILLKRWGTFCDNIDRLYLAGGFGCCLDILKASETGMIPKELVSRTETVGNSSLYGAVKFLTDPDRGMEAVNAIADITENVDLAADSEFNELYLNNMGFYYQ